MSRPLTLYHNNNITSLCLPTDHTRLCTSKMSHFFMCLAENKEELEKLAKNQQYENDSLCNLRHSILREFSTREKARGIIFTKTRRSTIALSQWIQENPKFADIGVKASYIIGGGGQSVVKPMTSVSTYLPQALGTRCHALSLQSYFFYPDASMT